MLNSAIYTPGQPFSDPNHSHQKRNETEQELDQEEDDDYQIASDDEASNYIIPPEVYDPSIKLEPADARYMRDLLSLQLVDWVQHIKQPNQNFCSHRLMVQSLPSSKKNHHQHSSRQQQQQQQPMYYVMSEFLIPSSEVFRAFFERYRAIENGDPISSSPVDEDLESIIRMVPSQEEDSLIKTQSLSSTSAITATTATELTTGPSTESPSQPSFTSPLSSSSIPNPTIPPLVLLTLPAPEHFESLLRVMYDNDLESWERTTFRPETIGRISQNVFWLQCSSELTMRPIRYYKNWLEQKTSTDNPMENLKRKDFEELERMYQHCVKNDLFNVIH